MTKKIILLFSFFSAFLTEIKAQTPTDNACTAPLFCTQSLLNGYSGTSVLPTKIYTKPTAFGGALESLEMPNWFRFIASTATLDLEFTTAACNAGTNGLQAMVFDIADCADITTFASVSNFLNAASPSVSVLNATGLVAGKTYYILIDGKGSAPCDYKIKTLNGTSIQTVASAILPKPIISGTTQVCEDASTVTFYVPKQSNATGYSFDVGVIGTNVNVYSSIELDSFYTVNFGTSFSPLTAISVTASYVSNCPSVVPPSSTFDVKIDDDSTIFKLPPFSLQCGQVKIVDTKLFVNPAPNNVQTTTSEFTTSQPNPDAASSCDVYNFVDVTRLACPMASGKVYVLRPNETVKIGGTDYGPDLSCTPKIVGNGPTFDTIYNAQILNSISPAAPVLNCNSLSVVLSASNGCANMVHTRTNQWFQVSNTGVLTLQSTNTTNKTYNNRDSTWIIIKDVVSVVGKPWIPAKIYFDTIKFGVNGVGQNDIPISPSLINGTLAKVTECRSDSSIYKLATKAPVGASYQWSLLRGGGTFKRGADSMSIIVKWAANTAKDTVRVFTTNGCNNSPQSTDLEVNIINFNNLNAGVDSAFCALTATMAGTSSGSSGVWSTVAGNPGTAAFGTPTSPTSGVTVSVSGSYKFEWKETQGFCSKADTVIFTMNSPPQLSGIVRDSCNALRSSTFAIFNIINGKAPYSVYIKSSNTLIGTLAAAGKFVSNPFYTLVDVGLEIRDANNCPSALITFSPTCLKCVTNPGAMKSESLSVCEGDSARATFLGGGVLEADDTIQFFLHTGNPKTGIVSKSKTPRFAFATGMTYETTYFISAVAANKLPNSDVDLTDPCFKESAVQVPVIFHRNPTATYTLVDSNLCSGTCAPLLFTMTGLAPYSIKAKILDPTSRDTAFNNVSSGFIVNYCPTKNATFALFSIKDGNGCTDSVKSKRSTVFKISQPVNAGLDTSGFGICNNLDTTINLTTLLRGANVGGVWTETSTTPSTGGAFRPALATFKTGLQAVGTYVFKYKVTPNAANSACPADDALISINIKSTPKADAGLDKTINCVDKVVSIGGNTPTSNTIFVQWSGITGGNFPIQQVNVPGKAFISVTEGGCTAVDTVVVFIDTLKPKAIITPVKDSLTCLKLTLPLDGSTSPSVNTTFSWLTNGSVYEPTNFKTSVSFGGLYTLKATNSKNFCTDTASIFIIENRKKPTVAIAVPKMLTCIDTIITLDASLSSTGNNYSIKWTTQKPGHFKADSTTLQPKVDSVGNYKLVITDKTNGCTEEANRIVLQDVDIPVSDPSVAGVLDCSNKTVSLSGNNSSIGVSVVYNWVTNNGNIESGEYDFNAVASKAGTYYFIVKNTSNQCGAIDSVVVNENTSRPQNFDITTTKPTCYGDQNGKINVNNVIGGTKPISFSIDGKVFQRKTAFANLPAGKYTLYLQDSAGCKLDTSFTIQQDNQIFVTLGPDATIKLGDSILVSVNTNVQNIKKIAWSSYSDSLCKKDSACLQQWVKPLRQTDYSVRLTDANGCKIDGSVKISVDKTRPVYIPNTFRPSSDGPNSIFMVFGSQVVKNIRTFQVYDRWGEKVFAQNNFMPDNPAKGWDGRFNDREAMPGIYAYFVEIEFLDGLVEIIQGDVTLIR